MEKSSDLEINSPPQSDKSLPGGFAPRISETMAELLVNTVAGTAQMVQVSVEAQKSAQLACFHAEHALTQARLSYMAARGLAERLLGFLSPPDFQGLFQILSQPPMPYSEFCTIIRRTENALLHPVLKCKPGFNVGREPRPASECSCQPDITDDGLQRRFPDLQFFRPCCVSKANDYGTDEEENQPLEIQDRNPSHHKKVECSKFLSKGTLCNTAPQQQNLDNDTTNNQPETTAKDTG
ncbi:uncharacterized protein LOC117666761 [Pantherophis guttatus]|uniref:Uncharacterized protein LOC117666761 n=1 Tax=Pantherophis guttatus TaxID=94885 RepID=A0A6P9BZH0_PANGU|nr:uncharacterized protein LOC117666761 [Pantherophis guttatus]XP_034275564.1 uncharacterized protein LOC117666761 [Pantherophis guttatus]XP_060548799.1 uncharacterized protein LOC117666761 [Pantherophis guttatus]